MQSKYNKSGELLISKNLSLLLLQLRFVIFLFFDKSIVSSKLLLQLISFILGLFDKSIELGYKSISINLVHLGFSNYWYR